MGRAQASQTALPAIENYDTPFSESKGALSKILHTSENNSSSAGIVIKAHLVYVKKYTFRRLNYKTVPLKSNLWCGISP